MRTAHRRSDTESPPTGAAARRDGARRWPSWWSCKATIRRGSMRCRRALPTARRRTRCERLAAMVFKALQEQRAVIHDLSLLGESDVSHQIDVQMKIDGQKRRTI